MRYIALHDLTQCMRICLIKFKSTSSIRRFSVLLVTRDFSRKIIVTRDIFLDTWNSVLGTRDSYKNPPSITVSVFIHGTCSFCAVGTQQFENKIKLLGHELISSQSTGHEITLILRTALRTYRTKQTRQNIWISPRNMSELCEQWAHS